jgi:hypothetical protein
MAFDELVAFLATNLGPAVFETFRPGQIALRAAQFVTDPDDVQAMTRRDDLLAMAPADRRLLFGRLVGRIAFVPQEATRQAMLAHLRLANDALGDHALDLDAMLAATPANGALPLSSRRLIDRVARGERRLPPSAADLLAHKRVEEGVGEIAFIAYWLHCHGHPDLPALLALAPPQRWPYLEDFALDTDRFPHEVEARLEAFAAELNR